jgi:hypothetical protein
MDLPTSYNVLRDADSDELILASDFSATNGRTVGGFGDLVPQLTTGRPIWETAPPPAETDAGMSAADHVERWTADIRTNGRRVHAILGYCVGSVFAAGIAEKVAEWQDAAPRVILFDPERPHAALLHRHYGDAVSAMEKLLSSEERAKARGAGQDALEHEATGGGGLPELAATLTGLVAEFGDLAFARAGLDASRRSQLLTTFRSFLFYLVSASAIDASRVWKRATAISSLSPLNGLNVLPPQARAGTVAEEIRFHLPHADLLRDASVAQVVDGLLS